VFGVVCVLACASHRLNNASAISELVRDGNDGRCACVCVCVCVVVVLYVAWSARMCGCACVREAEDGERVPTGDGMWSLKILTQCKWMQTRTDGFQRTQYTHTMRLCVCARTCVFAVSSASVCCLCVCMCV